MAKKPNKDDTAPAGVTLTVPANFAVAVHGHELTADMLAAMVPAGVAYLLANGFSQSITDAAAFTKDQKAGKSQDELVNMAAEKRLARFDAIMKGEVGHRVGARGTPIERVMKDIAIERIRVIAATKGVPMPKKDVLAAAVEKVLARQGDDIRAEAEARIASAKGAASAADDILG